MKLDFKGHIVRDISTTHFAMLSMWDAVTDYEYTFRYSDSCCSHRLILTLDVKGFQVSSISPYGEFGKIDEHYYRMLFSENLPDMDKNDIKGLCDYFKIFAGMVWALPVKLRQ